MDEGYAEIYGTGDLATSLGISPEHLIRTFKEEYGIPPKQYLTKVKVEQGCTLLLQGLGVEVVALSVGFSCGNYFSKVFRKEMGMTPTEFVQKNSPQKKEGKVGAEIYL